MFVQYKNKTVMSFHSPCTVGISENSNTAKKDQ